VLRRAEAVNQLLVAAMCAAAERGPGPSLPTTSSNRCADLRLGASAMLSRCLPAALGALQQGGPPSEGSTSWRSDSALAAESIWSLVLLGRRSTVENRGEHRTGWPGAASLVKVFDSPPRSRSLMKLISYARRVRSRRTRRRTGLPLVPFMRRSDTRGDMNAVLGTLPYVRPFIEERIALVAVRFH